MAVALNKKTVLAAILLPVSLVGAYYTLFSGEGSGAEPDDSNDVEFAVSEDEAEIMDAGYSEQPDSGESGTGTAKIGSGGGPEPVGNIEEILNKLMDRKMKMLDEIKRSEADEKKSEAGKTPEITPVESKTATVPREAAAAKEGIDDFQIRGIMAGGVRSRVLINGYILKEGDLLPNGYRIFRINRKSVIFKKEGEDAEVVKLIEPLESTRRGSDDEEEGEAGEEESEEPQSVSEPVMGSEPPAAEGDGTS